jgi:hypothetical protein
LGGGGNDWDEIRTAGAACTVPVTSEGGAEFDAQGLALGLPKRAVSALQPAMPTATAPSNASRDHRRPAKSTTARMGLLTHTYATNGQGS